MKGLFKPKDIKKQGIDRKQEPNSFTDLRVKTPIINQIENASFELETCKNWFYSMHAAPVCQCAANKNNKKMQKAHKFPAEGAAPGHDLRCRAFRQI